MRSVFLIPLTGTAAYPDPTHSWAAAGTQVTPVQRSPKSLKFVIPSSFPKAVYAYQLDLGGERFLIGLLNRPVPWWAQDLPGVKLVPGRPLRVFGVNLGWEKEAHRATRIRLEGPRSISVPATEADEYSATATLPADLPSGSYRLSVHNGVGGASCWSEPIGVTIAPAPTWPSSVFDVRTFGARGTGREDDSQAVDAALSAAAKTGGVVLFPRGRYLLSRTLVLPKKTILRGEGIDRVALLWRDSPKPPPSFIEGEGQFAIEEMTIYVSNHHNVIRTTGALGDVRVHHVRIRANPFFGHLKGPEIGERIQSSALANWGKSQTAIALAGPAIEISDCDVLSGNSSLFLTTASGSVVSRNRLRNGFAGGYYISSGQGVIFEDNEIAGASLAATGGGINNWGGTASEHVYFARNSVSLASNNDREGLTTDASGNAFFGRVQSASGTSMMLGENLHREASPSRPWVGEGAFIVGGKGAGQYRKVKSLSGGRLEIDRPWTIEPDGSSLLSVTHLARQMLFVGNTFTDCGVALQFYGSAVEFVAARNTSVRTAGFHAYGMDYHGIQPSWNVQFLGNRIEGGPCYRCGHDSISYSGEPHLGVYQFPIRGIPPEYADLSLARGQILRGNVLEGGLIQVGGTDNGDAGGDQQNRVSDVVVELNTITDSSRGLSIRGPAAGLVTRENRCRGVHKETTAE